MEARTRIKNTIYLTIIIVAVIIGGLVYSNYDFGNFNKSVREKGKTSFSRDKNVKYGDEKSYKVENKQYNDAMFYQTMQLRPNTAYEIRCKVKTKDVKTEKGIYTGGAQISIKDSIECSEAITGDNEWTDLVFRFNSKNRTSVDVGFRLGGYEEKCIGTAWFSDFEVKAGSLDSDKKWNIACFVIKNINVDVKINGVDRNVKLTMTDDDIRDIEANVRRLPSTLKNISNNQMEAECDTILINKTLTSISYDEKNEYYIDPKDVNHLIKKYLNQKEYDYIFVAARLSNLNGNKEILAHDWIGLGGMDYSGIGFSNIRLPDQTNSYVYKYISGMNTFPEEVFVHELLHTLESNEIEYGNDKLIALHDYAKYGYKEETIVGLLEWYQDYMRNSIKNAGDKTGLTKDAYLSKPIHASNFKYSYKIDSALKQPSNILETIISIIDRIKAIFVKK